MLHFLALMRSINLKIECLNELVFVNYVLMEKNYKNK